MLLMVMLMLPVNGTADPPLMEMVQPWFEPESRSFFLGKSNENRFKGIIFLKTVLTFNIVEKLLFILVPE